MNSRSLMSLSQPIAVLACVLALAACGSRLPAGASTEAAQSAENRPGEVASVSADEFSYEAYAVLLKKYIDDDGMVDYKALEANRAPLDEFVAQMGALNPDDFAQWSEDKRLAFWINAYNAITLLRIINHYPIQKGGLIAGLRFPKNSIRQIDGVWTKITNDVVGAPRTLDEIEHEIIRPRFNEPRIHAAIVCAAMGCPPLRNEPFVAERLDAQLDDQSRRFLAKPHRFRIDREAGTVYLSPILDWFGEDFVGVYNTDNRVTGHGKTGNAVLAYASRYVSEQDAQYILTQDYDVEFLDYDWSLNEQK